MNRLTRYLLLAGLIIVALLTGLLLGERNSLSTLWNKAITMATGKGKQIDPALLAKVPIADPAAGLPPSPLNELLKPDLTPQQQTSIIGQMLLDYYSTVHALPVGTWEETVAQLTGANPQKLTLIPKGHPALGRDAFQSTPTSPGVRIHIISSSGCAFQLIYDGPDKQPYTDDDLIRNFPPDLQF